MQKLREMLTSGVRLRATASDPGTLNELERFFQYSRVAVFIIEAPALCVEAPRRCTRRHDEVIFVESENGIHSTKHTEETQNTHKYRNLHSYRYTATVPVKAGVVLFGIAQGSA